MKKYLRCHMVEAQPMTRGAFSKKHKLALPANEDPKEKGYLVKYPDGYISWCPKAQFEKQGFPLEDGTKITQQDLLDFKLLGSQTVSTEKTSDDKSFTLVEMVYPTGFTDFAISTCVDPKNYSEQIGKGQGCDERQAMTFDEAIQEVKNGKRVTRNGWAAGHFIAPGDLYGNGWNVVENPNPLASDDAGKDTPTPESRAESIGKALGTALAPLALLNARPGDKPPEVHVNIWTIH